MARRNESERSADAQPRVYKAGDVHKRRVDRKSRPEASRKAAQAQPTVPEEEKPQRGVERTRFDNMTGLPAPQQGETTPAAESAAHAADAGTAPMQGLESGSSTGGAESAGEQPAPTKTSKLAALRAKLPVPSKHAQDTDAAADAHTDANIETGGDVQPEAGSPSAPVALSPAEKANARTEAGGAAVATGAGTTGPTSDAARPPEGKQPETAQAGGSKASAPADGHGGTDEGEDNSDQGEQAEAKPRKRKGLRVAIGVAAAVLVVALAMGGVFAWNRWLRYDDAADMQGKWYVVGTAVPVTVDAGQIVLTGDVAYDYEIDQHDKTISYTFGPMEGQGRYWFSDDRQYLVVTDGSNYTASSTAVDDLVGTFEGLMAGGDQQARLPEGEGIIALRRTPDTYALTAKLVAERLAVQRAKAAHEPAESDDAGAEEAAGGYADAYYDYGYAYDEQEYYEEQVYDEGQIQEEEAVQYE